MTIQEFSLLGHFSSNINYNGLVKLMLYNNNLFDEDDMPIEQNILAYLNENQEENEEPWNYYNQINRENNQQLQERIRKLRQELWSEQERINREIIADIRRPFPNTTRLQEIRGELRDLGEHVFDNEEQMRNPTPHHTPHHTPEPSIEEVHLAEENEDLQTVYNIMHAALPLNENRTVNNIHRIQAEMQRQGHDNYVDEAFVNDLNPWLSTYQQKRDLCQAIRRINYRRRLRGARPLRESGGMLWEIDTIRNEQGNVIRRNHINSDLNINIT
jgi:hypothetical protein